MIQSSRLLVRRQLCSLDIKTAGTEVFFLKMRKTDDAFRILRSSLKTENKWNKIADELLIIVAPRNKNVSIAGRISVEARLIMQV